MTEILKFKDHYESEREIRYFLVEPTNYCNLDCMGCNRRDVILTRPLLHMPISDYEIILDRNNAIQAALRKMEKNFILLVLGKGRENYQMIGIEKQPHSDIDIIKRYQYAG